MRSHSTPHRLNTHSQYRADPFPTKQTPALGASYIWTSPTEGEWSNEGALALFVKEVTQGQVIWILLLWSINNMLPTEKFL